MKLDEAKLVWMYRKMVEVRTFDEKVRDLYMRGLVPGTTHLYIGQEAVAVGVCANLRRDDYVFSTHRSHAHTIAKEVPLKEIAAEILGKATGCCKGKGGSMHLSRVDLGFVYSSAIVGGGVPLAVGAGLSIRLKKGDQVVASFFGDGASNTGGFHEGLNLASLWKLPVIFVCENNLYAISVSTKKSTSVENIADRAVAYGMPGLIVDGNDVLAVYEATRNAVDRARKGEGPTLLECKTYRWLGHFAGDPGDAYRTKEEVEAWKEKCPIKKLKTKLVEEGI
ncbi:MAG: thiamine pyrophosphate-dependent dehydrogenase E1 component subunit alpha, partial [Candidatus Bathyarchaeia archaeon]